MTIVCRRVYDPRWAGVVCSENAGLPLKFSLNLTYTTQVCEKETFSYNTASYFNQRSSVLHCFTLVSSAAFLHVLYNDAHIKINGMVIST